jgi:uncharacterized integral membrane protein
MVVYCTNCGTQAQGNQRFCTVCGSPLSGVTAMPRLSSGEGVHEARVLMGLSLDPPRQARWTILLRGILAIPLFLVLFVIQIAASIVAFVSWFAALFTGRVPDSFQEFLTGFLRLYANVYAYCYFLTPHWPGIAFSSKPNEQVTLAIDHVRLNRAAVFFRYILLFPATVVNDFLTLGVIPFVAIMWLWGLIAGREPRALHQALALVLRYQIRLQAYSLLATPTQPFGGLFGDWSDSLMAAPLAPTTSAPAAPLTFDPLATSTGNEASVPAAAPPPSLPTRWNVQKAARVIVIISLVLAVPFCVSVLVAERPLFVKLQDAFGRTIASASYTTTINAMGTFESSVQRCSTSAYVGCAARAATTASPQLSTAYAPIANTDLFPSNARVAANLFAAELDQLRNEVKGVQFSTQSATSMKVVQTEIPPTLNKIITAYKRLKAALRG